MKKVKRKTKKAVSKRIKKQKNNFIRKCAYTSHLASSKTTKQKRHLRKKRVVLKKLLKQNNLIY